MTTNDLTIGQLCDRYSACLAELDALRAHEKALNATKTELAAEVMRRCDAEGIDKLVGTGITLSIREKAVVKVSGDWEQILRELCDSGHGFVVQRRVTASKLQEEMDAGMRMPDGLSIETVREVSHRRS